MGQATVTEYLYSNAAATQSGSGWSTVTNSGASGGNYKLSSTVGDSFTFANIQGRAFYLEAATNPAYGGFTVTIDGVPQSGDFSCASATVGQSSTNNGTCTRVFIPIARNLTDSTHTIKVTAQTNNIGGTAGGSQSGGSGLAVNGLIAITGAKGTPTAGNFSGLGDSWGTGAGAQNKDNGWIPIIGRNLSTLLKSPITRNNAAESGVSIVGSGVSSGTPGAMYNFMQYVVPNTPQYLSIQFGANDMRAALGYGPGAGIGAGPADWMRHLLYFLSFIEDCLDTSQCSISIGTPSYISPALLAVQCTDAGGNGPTYGSNFGFSLTVDMIETAVQQTRLLVGMFPWARIANVYEAMDRKSDLMLPNWASSDVGLHPNDWGHAVVAWEHTFALMGANQDVQAISPTPIARMLA